MEDTSLAIHPGNHSDVAESIYHDIGNVLSYVKDKQKIVLQCERGYVTVYVYRSDIIRIIMNHRSKPNITSSPAVIVAGEETTETTIIDKNNYFLLKTTYLTVYIQKSPCRIQILDNEETAIVEEDSLGMGFNNQDHVMCYKKMENGDHFYGFGEKTGFLDKRDEIYTMWNSDVYAPHNPETDPLYQSIPYFMTLRSGRAHGLYFDNSFKSTFNMKADDSHYMFSAEGGQLDYYVLAGPSPKAVLEQYTYLTGRMPLPPKWAIGYQQSRYSYKDEQEVRELVNTFNRKGIPLDAVYLDIHYMEGYRVFTFDKTRFPNPKQLIQDLKEQGVKIVPIVDPGVKEDPEYSIYKDGILNSLFCKYIEGNVFFGDVWPGNSAFPDFANSNVRKWWGDNHKYYTDLGIEGIWNDMNEPAVFNETKTMDVKVVHNDDGEMKTHREFHNLYGLMMGEATYEGMKRLLNGKRPFLLTRAGFAGVQRYSAVWTGDNRSFWEHLEMSIPMVLNLGLSGVAFSGPDVGGFAHDSTGELLTRWSQVGVFTPYFRNHSALDVVHQEPWSFGIQYETTIKNYIELRYKWLPHLYTLFRDASVSGVPVMRPLFMVYPSDDKTYGISDQFLVGDNVLITPILRPHQRHRSVYFPTGRWTNYWTKDVIEGGTYRLIEAPLDTLPIFIKDGAIFAEGEVTANTAVPFETLTIHMYPSASKTEYHFYDDDGETYLNEAGARYEQHFSCLAVGKQVKINSAILNDNYKPSWRQLVIKVHNLEEDTNVIYNDDFIKVTIEDRTAIFHANE